MFFVLEAKNSSNSLNCNSKQVSIAFYFLRQTKVTLFSYEAHNEKNTIKTTNFK